MWHPRSHPLLRATIVASAMLVASGGCFSAVGRRPATADRVDLFAALFTAEPVRVDGRLDDAVWEQVGSYPLQLPETRAMRSSGRAPAEPGAVRVAWDANYLYIAFEFVDRDVVQEMDEDQAHHYLTGDVAEVFLKPEGAAHYWELYATPNGRKTSFFYPSSGRRGLPSTYEHEIDLRVAAQIEGTRGSWRDEDRGWSAEMAVPRAELARVGVPLTPEEPWMLLVGRYNYGRSLSTFGPELSSVPGVSRTSFHRHEEYVRLELSEQGRR